MTSHLAAFSGNTLLTVTFSNYVLRYPLLQFHAVHFHARHIQRPQRSTGQEGVERMREGGSRKGGMTTK